jgi:lycopene cyclase domain-containing protein
MVLLDARFHLFFWRSPRRAAIVLAVSVAFFVAWDAVGIALGIFARGESNFMTGILVGPEFPVEELGFLTFLCYLTAVLIAGARRMLLRREERRR